MIMSVIFLKINFKIFGFAGELMQLRLKQSMGKSQPWSKYLFQTQPLTKVLEFLTVMKFMWPQEGVFIDLISKTMSLRSSIRCQGQKNILHRLDISGLMMAIDGAPLMSECKRPLSWSGSDSFQISVTSHRQTRKIYG